jgi:tetratricopeptide (TPR) repeat protein
MPEALVAGERTANVLVTWLAAGLQQARRFGEAISACQDAAAIYRETGDQHREGMALGNLGSAYAGLRRFEEAIDCYQQNIAICRETGDRHGEGQTLGNLGNLPGAAATRPGGSVLAEGGRGHA